MKTYSDRELIGMALHVALLEKLAAERSRPQGRKSGASLAKAKARKLKPVEKDDDMEAAASSPYADAARHTQPDFADALDSMKAVHRKRRKA
jgi:hypothetical protein